MSGQFLRLPEVLRRCILKILKLTGREYSSKSLRWIWKDAYDIEVGIGTYGCFRAGAFCAGDRIGNYCSIADNVWHLQANHPMDHGTMSPIFYRKDFANNPAAVDVPRTNLEIGHDVWIGRDVKILSRVTRIGNGAVIGAGSVVIKNVDPYPHRMLLCISLCVIPYCFVNSYQSLYQSWGEFGRYNRSQMIVAAVPVLGSLAVFILKGNLNVNVFICLFLCTYWLLAIRILAGNAKVTVGVTANSVLDQTNLHTWKTGIAICIGSYIQVIIHSLDKQIVKLMFDTTEFARYCFALSLQSIPTLLITTLSQPLYHFMAKGQIRENQYPVLMRGLLMLGACCGIGYFACAWIVSAVLPDYILSLDIAAVYFLAIPPMAVLQGLYINLYKLKRQMKRYVIRSAEILFLLVLLNSLLLMSVKNMTSVAVTYVIVSYLWFWADSKFFPSTLVSLKDGLFLTGTVTAFLLSQTSSHLMSGALIYVIALVVLCATIYRREAWTAIHYLLRNRI